MISVTEAMEINSTLLTFEHDAIDSITDGDLALAIFVLDFEAKLAESDERSAAESDYRVAVQNITSELNDRFRTSRMPWIQY